MGKRDGCLVMIERLFLAVPRGCLQFVIVVFPDHTHYFSSEHGQFLIDTYKLEALNKNSGERSRVTWPSFSVCNYLIYYHRT